MNKSKMEILYTGAGKDKGNRTPLAGGRRVADLILKKVYPGELKKFIILYHIFQEINFLS
jgi:hypothetical protein